MQHRVNQTCRRRLDVTRLMRIGLAAVLVLAAFPMAEGAQRSRRGSERLVITRAEPESPSTQDDGEDDDVNEADAAKNFPPPVEKGGRRPRGAFCGLVVDNYTPLMVRVYVDGKFRGAVGPWGNLSVGSLSGDTVLEARARFADGKRLRWTEKCACERNRGYRWRLKE